MIKKPKKGFKKSLLKSIKIVLKKKKTKNQNIVVSNIRIYQKMKNQSYLSIEKNVTKHDKWKCFTSKYLTTHLQRIEFFANVYIKKVFQVIIRNYFRLESLFFFRRTWGFILGLSLVSELSKMHGQV